MSTGSTQPFTAAGTSVVAATTASGSVALAPSSPATSWDTVLVFNSTAAVAFVAFGNNAATALATSTPVPPGGSRLLYVGPVVNFAAALLASGTGNVYFTAGTGTVY